LFCFELEATQNSPLPGEETNTAAAPDAPSYLPWSSVVRGAKRLFHYSSLWMSSLLTPSHLWQSSIQTKMRHHFQHAERFVSGSAHPLLPPHILLTGYHSLLHLPNANGNADSGNLRLFPTARIVCNFHLQMTAAEPLFPFLEIKLYVLTTSCPFLYFRAAPLGTQSATNSAANSPSPSPGSHFNRSASLCKLCHNTPRH
ncbi:hypothetical protein GOODEAATRI_034517, partial [Goodea atripinnis]